MPDLSQTLAFRIVAGAARNALDGHPRWNVPASLINSIAKRAAGTLMAHTAPDALAALRSEKSAAVSTVKARRPGGGGEVVSAPTTAYQHEQALLQKAAAILARRITAAHRAQDDGRFIDLCPAIRILNREIARPPIPGKKSR